MANYYRSLHRAAAWQFRFLTVVLLVTVWGCGRTPTAHVTGTVTLDGKPLPTGTVTFYPMTAGRPAYGEINAIGRYEMRIGDDSGMPPGEYQVAVVANEPPIMPAGNGMPLPGKSLIPPHYGNVEESGLSYTAQADDQVHDIALESKSP